MRLVQILRVHPFIVMAILCICFFWLPLLWLLGVNFSATLGQFVQGLSDTIHWVVNRFNLFEPELPMVPYTANAWYNMGQITALLAIVSCILLLLPKSGRQRSY